MPLIRKLECRGEVLVLTIPRKFVETYDIVNEDKIEIITFGQGDFKIRKGMMSQSQKGVK